MKTIKHYTKEQVAMTGFHSSIVYLDEEDVLGLIDKCPFEIQGDETDAILVAQVIKLVKKELKKRITG